MADWGSGYVVDTAYVHDFCRVQVPATRFVLTSPRDDIELTFDTPQGRFQLRSEIYQGVIDAFAEGPLSLREVVERLPETNLGWASLTDAIKLLVGQGHLAPALPHRTRRRGRNPHRPSTRR